MTVSPGPPKTAAVRAVMQANRRRDTKPERLLRSALHQQGYRFRVDLPVRAGDRTVRPDIVFPRVRVAVFVDGCFWHRCPRHGVKPHHNSAYWQAKLDRNVERDRLVTCALQAEGWNVLRIWEHTPTATAAALVVDALAESA